jgi:2-succinyl-5-enolpyruvyl-6-hydroxy-3-cyclohexene-1-carboxylate synthase
VGRDRTENQRLYEIADRDVIQTAPNINRFWAGLIVDELVRNGVSQFYIAPGSRSSPLVAAVVEHESTDAIVHFDERGTAFAALGHGRATGRPAVWITTSGTAAANGYPAVIEAALSRVPLLALTADRPPELREAGANQAIDQNRLFGVYPEWFFDLPCPASNIDPAFILTTVDHAVHRASTAPAGPVHINCPFREPLAPSTESYERPDLPDRWSSDHKPFTRYRPARLAPDPQVVHELEEPMAGAERGLIVAGELRSLAEAEAVAGLSARVGWPVVADATSRLRLGSSRGSVVAHPHYVCAAQSGQLQPDLVLRFGGPLSSKAVQQMIDTRKTQVIAIQDHPLRRDPGHNVSQVVVSETEAFCGAIEYLKVAPNEKWTKRWLRAGERVSAFLEEYFGSRDSLSEPVTAASISRLLPQDHTLFAASSMPIRDVDMFGAGAGALRNVISNRGASGIDGTVACSVGYQRGAVSPLTLLIGDLALLHDLNSLALLRSVPITLVVVNNGGGGIFNFLPIASHPSVFEPWFTTPHEWSFEAAARMFDIEYVAPSSLPAFEQAYLDATRSTKATIIEVSSDRAENRALHEALRTGAIEAVASELH